MARPRLLVLDEATSALDTVTEQRVLQNIQARSDRDPITTFVIAHRLSTVKRANEILCMDVQRECDRHAEEEREDGVGGVVVERGTHDELLAKGGVYARLIEAQLQGKETKGPALLLK